jgi:hypothetical protein
MTLPLRFGPEGAAQIMAPFYVFPWILFIVCAGYEIGGRRLLSVGPWPATLLGLALVGHGAFTAWHLIRRARDLADPGRGRLAWRNLYLLMMAAQVGVGLIYLA